MIKELKMDLIDELEADSLLKKDVQYYVNLVNIHLKVQVERHQFEAIVLFVYNCGISDTLFIMINKHYALTTILEWWRTHYVTASGVKIKGLQIRRLFESNLFAYGW
jgi:GH24 family phage-related lysozyme (muramidase)